MCRICITKWVICAYEFKVLLDFTICIIYHSHIQDQYYVVMYISHTCHNKCSSITGQLFEIA
jgi:hypothetical protein